MAVKWVTHSLYPCPPPPASPPVSKEGVSWLYQPDRLQVLASEIAAAGGIVTPTDFMQVGQGRGGKVRARVLSVKTIPCSPPLQPCAFPARQAAFFMCVASPTLPLRHIFPSLPSLLLPTEDSFYTLFCTFSVHILHISCTCLRILHISARFPALAFICLTALYLPLPCQSPPAPAKTL